MEILDEIAARNPEYFGEPCSKIKTFVETKHWYELGVALYDFLVLEGVEGERLEIFHKFVSQFAQILNPFQLAKIIQVVSEDVTSPSAALEFLKDSEPLVDENVDARHWIKLQIIGQYVVDGDFETALGLLNEVEKEIGQQSHASVRSLFYRTVVQMDKARGDFDALYEDGLLYLSASSKVDDLVLAYDLCASALCARTVFSFGELASHGILDKLEGTENSWLRDLILILEKGSHQSIAEFESKYLGILKTKPLFVPHLDMISTKVRLCVLQELIFARPFESRVFEFQEVSEACAVPQKQVELLLLRAFSSGLIRGFIDEVDERFVVTWCKPKTLNKERLIHLKEQVDRWIQRVHEQRILLENRAQPVIG